MLQTIVNSYKFNYVEEGNNGNLILVHGSSSDFRTWHKQMHAFGKYYRTIAFSRRYHWPNEEIKDEDDYSMKQHIDDLEEFIKSIGKKPVNLVGHSYGAFVCLLLAIKNPKIIKTLTLAEPPVVSLYISNSPKPSEIINLFFSKPRLSLALVKFGAKGLEPAKKALLHNDLDKALEISAKAILGIDTFQNISESRLEQARVNFFKAEFLGSGFLPLKENQIQKVNIPTLLIIGNNSPKIWQLLTGELNRLIPHSEIKVIKMRHILCMRTMHLTIIQLFFLS